jgi:hypothetical protein
MVRVVEPHKADAAGGAAQKLDLPTDKRHTDLLREPPKSEQRSGAVRVNSRKRPARRCAARNIRQYALLAPEATAPNKQVKKSAADRDEPER